MAFEPVSMQHQIFCTADVVMRHGVSCGARCAVALCWPLNFAPVTLCTLLVAVIDAIGKMTQVNRIRSVPVIGILLNFFSSRH